MDYIPQENEEKKINKEKSYIFPEVVRWSKKASSNTGFSILNQNKTQLTNYWVYQQKLLNPQLQQVCGVCPEGPEPSLLSFGVFSIYK